MGQNRPPALIWGATGQAKVIRPIIEASGYAVAAVYDRDPDVGSPFPDVPRLRDDEAVENWLNSVGSGAIFAVAIGSAIGRDRLEIGERISRRGLDAPALIHPRGWLADTAQIGEGSQVLALAGVSEYAVVGRYCIVNTNASVDHDCVVGDGVHVMPGATVAGEVTIGDFATVGSNATILPRLKIGAGAFVGAGAVVTKNVAAGAVVIGVPARQTK